MTEDGKPKIIVGGKTRLWWTPIDAEVIDINGDDLVSHEPEGVITRKPLAVGDLSFGVDQRDEGEEA